MKYIERVRMHNFKRFHEYEILFHPGLNVLIGDNETGKSTVLAAIDLVLTASRSRVESIGLDSLINKQAIQEFFKQGKKFKELPILRVEIFFNQLSDPLFNGKNNTLGAEVDGVRLICKPDDTLGAEIKAVLDQPDDNFPYEYYQFTFETFSASYYSGTKKPLRLINVDTSVNYGDYATREYTRSIYESNLKGHEKAFHTNEYRRAKEAFNLTVLREINARTVDFTFGVKSGSKTNLESDLSVFEDGINIESKGKGKQCLIKASLALSRRGSGHDVILIEEPESHLSHIQMNRLVETIVVSSEKQVIVTTHNPFVASRLDLRNLSLLGAAAGRPGTLAMAPESVARYFMKAPGSSLLEFILSPKTVLVEGAAEYILSAGFFERATGRSLQEAGVHVISVNGTGFKNYMHIAKLLRSKVAIIRDNDGNYAENVVENYRDLADERIRVFADVDPLRSTFEMCIYADNTAICNEVFSAGRRSLTVEEYMLGNKTEVALELLEQRVNDVVVPSYIVEAFLWLNS